MSYEYNHTCSNCEENPKNDECYCDKCADERASDAYEEGKKEGEKIGYDKGYEEGQARAGLSN